MSTLAGSVWPVRLWERRQVLIPFPPLAGSYCPTAKPAAGNVSPRVCAKRGASAGNCRFMLLCQAVSMARAQAPDPSCGICLRGERVPEEGCVSKCSWARTASVTVPASATAAPWCAPALDCAGTGVCRAVQRARK